MSIVIRDRIWPLARELSAEYEEWSIALLLVTPNDLFEAERAAQAALIQIWETHEAEDARWGKREERPWPGSWSWMRVKEGLWLGVEECDDHETTFRELVAGMEQRGIVGVLDLWDRPLGVGPPRQADLLVCRMRVRGQRLHQDDRAYRWQRDPDAFADVLRAAQDWWQRFDATDRSLSVGGAGLVSLDAGEDATSRVLDYIDGSYFARLFATSVGAFRGVGVSDVGSISLVVGGTAIQDGGWQAELEALISMLREHAGAAVYGRVWRGWRPFDAFISDGSPIQAYDWPMRDDSEPRGTWGTWVAFEDLYAPDAYGVQLLGPGYADRPVTGTSWHIENLDGATRIVRHLDPDAWFAQPFVAMQELTHQGADAFEPPEVLHQARLELDEILYRPGVLARRGFPDMA